jgi:hypothetical protein
VPAAPVSRPSGVPHPALWAAPAAVLMLLLPTGFQVFCALALLIGVSRWMAAHPGVRIDRETVDGAAGLVLLALVIVALARGVVPGQQAAPEPARPPAAVADAPRPEPAPPGLTARVTHFSTTTTVDARPELMNREEVERELADRLFRARTWETRGVSVAVWVRSDGTVDPQLWMKPGDEAHAGFVTEAAPALSVMRFRPLTRNGTPIPALVWVEVELVRSTAAALGAPIVASLRG